MDRAEKAGGGEATQLSFRMCSDAQSVRMNRLCSSTFKCTSDRTTPDRPKSVLSMATGWKLNMDAEADTIMEASSSAAAASSAQRPRTGSSEAAAAASAPPGKKGKHDKDKGGESTPKVTPPAAATKAKRKAKAEAEQDDDTDINKHIAVLYKLSLQNTQISRTMTGIVMNTHLVKATDPVAKAGLAAGVAYDKAVKEAKRQGQDLPMVAPHIQVFVQCLSAMVKKEAWTGQHPDLLRQLDSHIDRLDSPETVATLVRYWRVKEAYSGNSNSEPMVKIQWALDPMTTCTMTECEHKGPELAFRVQVAIMEYFEVSGATVKRGPPPKGQLERVAQSQLNSLQGKRK